MVLFRLAVLVVLGDEHLAGFHLGDPGVADGLDVLAAEDRLHQPLGIADAAEAEVADVGFGGDEGHRHLVANLAPAQVGFHDHREFVGRAEARGALYGAGDDRAGVGDEFLPGTFGRDRMVDVADRLGMPLRTHALDLVEGQLGAGRYDQEVVVEEAAVIEFDAVVFRMQALDADTDEVDLVLSQRGAGIEFDFLAFSPVDRNPRVGGHEMEGRVVRNNGDAVRRAGVFPHFKSHGHAAQTTADDDDVCHECLSSRLMGRLRLMGRATAYLLLLCLSAMAALTGSVATLSPAARPAKTSISPAPTASPRRSWRRLGRLSGPST